MSSGSQVNTGGGGGGGSGASSGGSGSQAATTTSLSPQQLSPPPHLMTGGGGGGGGSSGNSAAAATSLAAASMTAVAGSTAASSADAAAAAAAQAAAANLAASDSSPRESGDDSEDESEILEESPCGRWLKRREEVDQRDVPGIDCVHLAMDTEEGVEVVWNEVQYATLAELNAQEDKMRQVFDNLLQLDHQNIVKFHRYWTEEGAEGSGAASGGGGGGQAPNGTVAGAGADGTSGGGGGGGGGGAASMSTASVCAMPRVIFITEYMSSGSLKQFLKRTKRNAKRLPLEAWRRWCTQILSALSYLHSCIPPVIHGNLTCDSIFIQHNGLVKIGSVVPDAVHYSVRQHRVDAGLAHHFMAPEYGAADQLTAAVDIYAFGMCALEMAALEIQPSGGSEAVASATSAATTAAINEETILRTINSLEHDLQRDLIFKCLRRNPAERPSASDLLFHPLLFEVHSLKLLAAHCLVFAPKNRTMFSETVIDGMMQRYNRPEVIMAKLTLSAASAAAAASAASAAAAGAAAAVVGEENAITAAPQSPTTRDYRLADVPSADKLEKFVEDVKFGVYPLTAFSGKKPPHFRSRAASPERADSVKSATPEPVDIESRRIVNMMCSVKKLTADASDISMTILLRMDDKMNRQLTCQVNEEDSAGDLTQELVRLGFVHIDDQDKIQALLEETLRGSFAAGGAAFEQGAQPLTFSATINEPGGGGANPSSSAAAAASSSHHDMTAQKTAATATMAALNQLERNWSVADLEPTTAAAGEAVVGLYVPQEPQQPILQQQHQQQQHQQQQQQSAENPLATAAAAAEVDAASLAAAAAAAVAASNFASATTIN